MRGLLRSQIVDELPTNISEIASSYVMLRTNQIRQYAHLNLENPNISESLQGFAAQLSAEFEFLQTQWEGKNLKQTFQTILQPENVWLENLISSLEMSQDALERKGLIFVRLIWQFPATSALKSTLR